MSTVKEMQMQECQGKETPSRSCGFVPGFCLTKTAAGRGYSPEWTAYAVWQESAQKLSYDRWVDNPNQW